MTVKELALKYNLTTLKIISNCQQRWSLNYKEDDVIHEHILVELEKRISEQKRDEDYRDNAPVVLDGTGYYLNNDFGTDFWASANEDLKAIAFHDSKGKLLEEKKLMNLRIFGIKKRINVNNSRYSRKRLEYSHEELISEYEGRYNWLYQDCLNAFEQYRLENQITGESIKIENVVEIPEQITYSMAIRILKLINLPYTRQLIIDGKIREKEVLQVAQDIIDKFGKKLISLLLILPVYELNRNKDHKYKRVSSQYVKSELRLFNYRFKLDNRNDLILVFKNSIKKKGATGRIFRKPNNGMDKEELIGIINDSGNIKEHKKNLSLNLFFNNENKKLYPSVKKSTCPFCRKELTHPDSILNGFGETCGNNLNLPYYKF